MLYNDNHIIYDCGGTMEEYTLYLDESKNADGTYFTVSGIVIKNKAIEILNAAIL